jgi:hypothetical protein
LHIYIYTLNVHAIQLHTQTLMPIHTTHAHSHLQTHITLPNTHTHTHHTLTLTLTNTQHTTHNTLPRSRAGCPQHLPQQLEAVQTALLCVHDCLLSVCCGSAALGVWRFGLVLVHTHTHSRTRTHTRTRGGAAPGV